MKEHYDAQNEAQEKQNNMLNNKGKGEISRPNIAPNSTYTTKAAKK
jgi:hypothetical protein